jgi:hypothetical protein
MQRSKTNENHSDEVAWYSLTRALRMTGDGEWQKKALPDFQRLHALECSRLSRAGILFEACAVPLSNWEKPLSHK